MVTDEIWVYIESHDGVVTDTSYEVVYAAMRLTSQKNVTMAALLVGTPDDSLYEEMNKYGIEKIYVLDHLSLVTYTTDAYVAAFAEVISEYRPLAVLFPGSINGSDFAPRLSARMKLGFTANCVKFEWGNGTSLLMTRSIYKSQSHATYVAHVAGTQLATVLPGAFPKALPQANSNPTSVIVLELDLQNGLHRTEVLGWIEADASTVDLTEAKMIVAGGRGAKSQEGFRIIHQLSAALGASVGASRVATDEGWVPFERQIGQTGKIVSPLLYIACGISGAVHHTMGIKDSDMVLAINTDKTAAIFGVSDLGLVGDMHEVLPLLIAKIQHHQSAKMLLTQAISNQ